MVQSMWIHDHCTATTPPLNLIPKKELAAAKWIP